MQIVWCRLVLGACVLLVWGLVSGQPVLLAPRLWGHAYVLAALLCVVPFTLYALAERGVPSHVAIVLNATTPLLTALLVSLARTSRSGASPRGLGLVISFAGVAVIGAPWRLVGAPHDWVSFAACLAAACCYALGFTYLHHCAALRTASVTTISSSYVLAGAALMLAATPWLATPLPRPAPGSWLAVVVLGGAGTGIAYVWNTRLVMEWGAARASSVTFVMPCVGIPVGALLLGETVTWNGVAGMALVSAGWWIAATGRDR